VQPEVQPAKQAVQPVNPESQVEPDNAAREALIKEKLKLVDSLEEKDNNANSNTEKIVPGV